MKKVLSLMLVLMLTFCSISITSGCSDENLDNSQQFTYDDYLKGIEEGWIGQDVPYEEFLRIQNEANEFENDLEKNPNF